MQASGHIALTLNWVRRMSCLLAGTTLLTLVACGGGGGSGDDDTGTNPPPPPIPAITIEAPPTNVSAGAAAISLVARVTGSTSIPVWTLEGPGSLSATTGTTVSYIPPDTETLIDPGTAAITAALDTSTNHRITITLTPVVTPGHHWTVTRAEATPFSHIAFGNGQYVATSSKHSIWSSSDGLSWSQYNVGNYLDGSYRGVAWGNSGWVAIADSGSVANSIDGVNWSHTTSLLPTGTYPDVVAGNGKYIAVGGSGNSWVSANGLLWQDSNRFWHVVAYGNGYFLALSTDRLSLFRSTDGLNWIEITNPGISSTILFVDNKFVVKDSIGNEWVSWDGTTWTGANTGINSPTLFLSAGTALYGWANQGLMVRFPGSAWQRVHFSSSYPVAQPTSISYSPITGYRGISGEGWIMRSTDGIDWTTQIEGGYRDIKAMADFKDAYIAVTSNGWALRSVDGTNWSAISMYPEQNSYHGFEARSLASGNGILIAVGCTTASFCFGDDDPGHIVRSTDGTTWVAATSSTIDKPLVSVVHDGVQFLTMDRAGQLYTSVDGDHWIARGNIPSTSRMERLVFGGGRYLAIDASGSPWRSQDGITWSLGRGVIPNNTGEANMLTDATWDGHQFVGISSLFPASMVSADGDAWIQGAGSGGFGSSAIASCNGVTVRVGSGTIQSSVDGLTWHTRLWEGEPLLYAVTCARGRFVAGGFNSAIMMSGD